MSQIIVPSDGPVTLDRVSALSTLQRNAIVRPDNPPVGIAGFLFHVDLDQAVELTSDITDHYVENNTAVQDHIALKPETITLHGLIAELSTPDKKLPGYIGNPNPNPVNSTMLPELSKGAIALQATTAYNAAVGAGISAAINGGNIGRAVKGSLKASGSNLLAAARYNAKQVVQSSVRKLLAPESIAALIKPGVQLPPDTQNAVNVLKRFVPGTVDTIVKSVKNLVDPQSQVLLAKPGFFTNHSSADNASLYSTYSAAPLADENKQTKAFMYFYNLWKSRQIFSVETPWGLWTNMAIVSCRTTQDEDTKYMSDFVVTFKKIRIATNISISVGQLSHRTADQAGVGQPAGTVVATSTVPPAQKDQIIRDSANDAALGIPSTP